jgi:hypothetical protein
MTRSISTALSTGFGINSIATLGAARAADLGK